jgi:hypothetical protein
MLHLFRRLFNLFRRSTKESDQTSDQRIEPSRSNPASNPSSNQSAKTSLPGKPSSRHVEAGSRSIVPDSLGSGSLGPSKNSANNLQIKNLHIQNLKQVLNVLRAYVVTFGRPSSDLEMRAVIGAIVAVLPAVQIENSQLEGFANEAIAAFESLGLEPSLVDMSAQLLAEQVAVWLREQQATVSNVLSAYLQQFAPDNATWTPGDILGLVQTVVATLNDGSLSRSGGRVLVDQVVKAFDLNQALNRWIAPEWVALAQRVASYASKGDLQQEVRSIAWAYIQQFQAILSPQLIEQIVEQGSLNLSPAEVLAGNFDDFSQMLFYKFQLLEADPVVTKSHGAIATNIRQAIAELQARQPTGLDVSKGIATGELEVSSPFKRFGRAKT